MSMSTQRYTELLKNFLDYSQVHIDYAAVEVLKLKYEKQINSRRCFENIIDIKSLLKVLEKRGILQYDKIQVLEEIVLHYMNNEYIKQLIIEYGQCLEENSKKFSNLYSSAIVPKAKAPTTESGMAFRMTNTNVEYSTNSRFFMNHAQYSTTTQMPSSARTVDNEEELKKRVINKISKDIGKHWADVVRLLNIKESDIDRIEIKYMKDQNYKQMFFEAMELYFEEPQPNWKIELKNALEHGRRRDLKEMADRLFIS